MSTFSIKEEHFYEKTMDISFHEGVASISGVKVAVIGGEALQVKVDLTGRTVEITFLGGAKLAFETKYEITGKAKDSVGNKSAFKHEQSKRQFSYSHFH